MYKYLTFTFLKELDESFEKVKKSIQSRRWNSGGGTIKKFFRKKIISEIQHLWKKVADWYILKEVMANTSSDSVIAIMGNMHFQNLSIVLENAGRIISVQVGKAKDCVSLMRTGYIDSPITTLGVGVPHLI